MKVSVYNLYFNDTGATVDIEDMPLPLAKELVEALTIIKVTAGQFYPELVKFRDELRDTIERASHRDPHL